MNAQPNAGWDSPKLRAVAAGCTFFVALGWLWLPSLDLGRTRNRSFPLLLRDYHNVQDKVDYDCASINVNRDSGYKIDR